MNTSTTFRHHHHAHPHHLTILLFILTGFFLLTSCNSGGPVEVVPQKEQTVFTAQDTLDIMALATAVHPGTVSSIVIFTVPEQVSAAMNTAAKRHIMILRNHVTVRFEPEVIGDATKRYFSLLLSNITWDESESYRDESGYRTQSNWITSDSWLYSYDKTVFALDSCTVEATVSDADNALVTQLLNLISTSTYSVDSSVLLSEPQFEPRFKPLSEPIDLTEITEITGYDYATTSLIHITCNNSTTYTFLFENGAATIKSVVIRFRSKYILTSIKHVYDSEVERVAYAQNEEWFCV